MMSAARAEPTARGLARCSGCSTARTRPRGARGSVGSRARASFFAARGASREVGGIKIGGNAPSGMIPMSSWGRISGNRSASALSATYWPTAPYSTGPWRPLEPAINGRDELELAVDLAPPPPPSPPAAVPGPARCSAERAFSAQSAASATTDAPASLSRRAAASASPSCVTTRDERRREAHHLARIFARSRARVAPRRTARRSPPAVEGKRPFVPIAARAWRGDGARRRARSRARLSSAGRGAKRV